MSKILIASLLVLFIQNAACADLQITEGNLQQPICEFKDHLDTWVFTKNPDVEPNVQKTIKPIGKTISSGDMLFYAHIVNEKKEASWQTPDRIEMIGGGFFDSNTFLSSGDSLQDYGVFTSPDKKHSYHVIKQGVNVLYEVAAIAVNDKGYLCSGLLTIGTEQSTQKGVEYHNYTMYQKNPMTFKKINSAVVSDDSIALTLVSQDEVSSKLQLKLLRGGKVTFTKNMDFDSLSGSFDISGLQIEFDKTNKSALRIKSITEPINYSQWREKVLASPL